jgi:hypothetical protein
MGQNNSLWLPAVSGDRKPNDLRQVPDDGFLKVGSFALQPPDSWWPQGVSLQIQISRDIRPQFYWALQNREGVCRDIAHLKSVRSVVCCLVVHVFSATAPDVTQ